MANPFSSRVKRTAPAQSASELDQFLNRLRGLGASDDELETVRTTWDDFDDGWTLEDRRRLTVLDDEALAHELAATRAEYEHDTTDETTQAATDAASFQAAQRAEAAEIIVKPIGAVLAWVGTDVGRAIAILDLEQSDNGAKRKGIVGPLTELIAGPDPGEPTQFAGDRPLNLDTAGAVAGESSAVRGDTEGSPT